MAQSPGVELGATITVTLHVPAEGGSQPAAPSLGMQPVQGDPLAGVDVLIVEDHAEASEMLAMMLTDAGAQVRTAVDYDSALVEAKLQWPLVLVSDIGLPGRDGYELMRTLRELTSAFDRTCICAIALTAFSRDQDQVRALEAGFDVHLAKPVQPHTLIAAIAQLSNSPTKPALPF